MAFDKPGKKAAVFYVVTMGLSLIVSLYYNIHSQMVILELVLTWLPGIIGILCAKVFFRKERMLGFCRKFNPVYLVMGLLIPVLYLVPSYLLAWALIKAPISFTHRFLPGVFIEFPLLLFAAAGEEFGWRGFAYPMLEQACGTVKAVLINSLLWGLWHLPMIIGGIYDNNGNLVYDVISFLIVLLPVTVILCWLRDMTGSIIPGILLHSMDDFLNMCILGPGPSDKRLPYLAGEQGMITLASETIIAGIVVFVWIKQRKIRCQNGNP